MRREPEALPTGEIVPQRPALHTVKGAADYLACSSSLLDHLRASDTQRRLRGEAPLGPVWVRAPYGIRYKTTSLDEWIERNAIPFGVMEAKRRGATAPDALELKEGGTE